VPTHNEQVDVAIIGGGIAGLWLLGRMHALGYSTILLSKGPLGQGQSIASQGIIHGGLKYTLDGMLKGGALNAHKAKTRWKECLSGQGEFDLRPVVVLAKNLLLWSSKNLYARLSLALARQLFSGNISGVPLLQYPEPFKSASFRSKLYQMDDLVVDTTSLLRTLSAAHEKRIRQMPEHARLIKHQGRIAIESRQQAHRLWPNMCILAAGSGNAAILGDLDQRAPRMQRRPLRQLILRAPSLPNIYGHYLAGGSKPYFTISTHRDDSNKIIWYIGGDIAEQNSSAKDAQILGKLAQILAMPQLRKAQLSEFYIDRAEPRQFARRRPEQPYAAISKTLENLMTVWPVKLTMAPLLADTVTTLMAEKRILPSGTNTQIKLPEHMVAWPKLGIASTPWSHAK
jgi:glycine/D-amino acid oxidase-like deaminating enzyme